jgi:hypothetical protein
MASSSWVKGKLERAGVPEIRLMIRPRSGLEGGEESTTLPIHRAYGSQGPISTADYYTKYAAPAKTAPTAGHAAPVKTAPTADTRR